MEPTSNQGTKVRCLAPVKIVNPHYIKICNGSKKEAYDKFRMAQDYELVVGCGKCYLCKKSYQSKWRLRLNHEFMYGGHDISKSYFCTLTLNNNYYMDALENPSRYVRAFLEKYRYQVKKRFGKGRSVFHWIVSERGETTGRYHFHGVFFDCVLPKYIIEKCWQYGFVSFKNLTLKRCGYVTKYITKGNKDAHVDSVTHFPQVWCSAGIGKCYTEQSNVRAQHVTPHGIIPFIVKNNFVYGMPRYYKQKLFSEAEREILKLQYYAENADNNIFPPPPYSVERWSTSSPEVLLNEIDRIKLTYVKPKQIFNSLLKNEHFVFETIESFSSSSEKVEL